MNTTAQIEDILDQFDVNLSNYEIVNIDEKKGWSAKHLYLIVEKNEQFILKGKSEDQLAGYLEDIEISNFLSPLGFNVRTPIKTRDGEYYFLKDYIYWDLKTYIPGSVLDFNEYTDDTVISLAAKNTSYINASLNNPSINKLKLKVKDYSDVKDMLDKIHTHKEILDGVGDSETQMFFNWFNFAQEEVGKILRNNPDFSIIHNDLNNKNILLDLESMEVVSFIDWDHGCISTPLKDIIEPINEFYDFIPQRFDHVRQIYVDAIKSNYQLTITDSELDFLQVYFYTLNKWNYIITFARLISELGNTTNELEIFEDVISTQLAKLKEIGKRYNTY